MAVNSSQNGSTERSTRKGRAGVLPSNSCLPPGTGRAGELLLLLLTRTLRAYEYECTLRVYVRSVTMHFDGRYVSERAGGIIRVHHLAHVAGRSSLNPLSRTSFLSLRRMSRSRRERTNTDRKIIRGRRSRKRRRWQTAS